MTALRSIIFVSALWWTSCDTRDSTQSSLPKSDTTKVLELAIRTAFQGFLPGVSAVKSKYYYKDSILFTSASLSLDSLPKAIDTLKFKVLSKDQLCKVIKNDSLSGDQPNYLNIQSFQKSDTGYYVQIASLSCFLYGGGGTLGLYIVKQKDTFYIKDRIATSIN